MSSVALYRQIITDPRHGDPTSSPPTILPGLTDDQITFFLEQVATVSSAAFWGKAFPRAMVLYAAHMAESSPGLLAASATSGGTGTVGPLTQQRDDTLQRTYAVPAGAQNAGLQDAWFMTTTYGMQFLQLRATRCRTAPFAIPIL